MSLARISDKSNRSALANIIPISLEFDLVNILKDMNVAKRSINVVAGRTSLTGGCIPKERGFVVDIHRICTLSSSYPGYKAFKEKNIEYALDKDGGKAIFPCGISIENLDEILLTHGFFYPPTPGYKKCTLGGTVSTNASGPRTFQFGTTRESIFFLRVLLPNGEICEIERGNQVSNGEDFLLKTLSGQKYSIPIPRYDWNNIKNVTGIYNKLPLDCIDLFIGSEGVLGIFTDIGIELKRNDEPIQSEIFFFGTQQQSLDAGFEAKKNKALVSVEFMDKNAIELSGKNDFFQYNGAIELEFYDKDRSFIDEWKSKHGVQFILSGDKVAPFRYGIPLNMSEILIKNNTIKIGTDFCVPDNKFPEIIKYYFDRMAHFHVLCGTPKYITSAMWGHFGNNHLHINFLPVSIETQYVAEKLYKEMAEYIVKNGGVIMAEHGVGKKQFFDGTLILEMQNKNILKEIEKLKKILDPNNILNKGNYGLS